MLEVKAYIDWLETSNIDLKISVYIINNKAHGLEVQPLKDFIPGSSPSANRKLLTHILTNIRILPHTDIWVGWLHYAQPRAISIIWIHTLRFSPPALPDLYWKLYIVFLQFCITIVIKLTFTVRITLSSFIEVFTLRPPLRSRLMLIILSWLCDLAWEWHTQPKWFLPLHLWQCWP